MYTAGQALTERDPSRPATATGPQQAITERGFRGLVEEHQSAVVSYCWRFTGHEDLARELAQEVFLTLWSERDRYQERGSLRLYLLRIARLRCLASSKRRRSRTRLGEALSHTSEVSAPALVDGPDAKRVMHALAAMKPAQRELVILRYFHDLGTREIAEVTGCRIGTVKSRLSRSLEALRAEMNV